MNVQFGLAVAFLVMIGVIYIWDAYTLAAGRPLDSVSVVVRGWAGDQPILAFVVGVIVGHIFW